MPNQRHSYWFPRRALHSGHFPLWTWLFPPFWLILVPVYLIWLAALAILFVVSIPVNILRLMTHKQPVAQFDVYTGNRLPPKYDTSTGKRLS